MKDSWHALQASNDTDYYNLTASDIKILKVTAIVVLMAFLANLCLLVHNVLRYLIPLKIKGMLIALFYIFAGVMTVARTVELIYYVVPSNESPSLTFEKCTKLGQSIADTTAETASVMLGCLFVATMY